MRELARTPVTPVWFLLMAATATSWWIGADHGIADHKLATVLIMSVAFVKVRFVGMYFMEIRHAPPWLRLVLHAWYGLGCTAILAIFLLA